METPNEIIRPKRTYKKRNPTGWGGARAGAGRKPTVTEHKVPLSLSVNEDTFRKYQELRRRGLNPCETIEDTICNLAALCGIK